MNSSALPRLADSRWRRSMTAYADCFCPHVLGRKSGRLRAFVYQFGGSSNSGLPLTPEAVGGWRGLAVEKLSHVQLRAETGHTESRSRRQTCIDEVDFDADAQAEQDPR